MTLNNVMIEFVIKTLTSTPLDSLARTKQKVLAQYVENNIEYINIPLPVLKDLLLQICKLHEKYSDLDGSIIKENIKKENYNDYYNLISLRTTISTQEVNAILEQLTNKILASKIINASDEIQEKLESLTELSSYDQVVDKYKELITGKYVELLNDIRDDNELDFASNNITSSLDYLVQLSTSQLSVSPGFQNMEKVLHVGGFESNRLYIFAGKPGMGKSALLLNLAMNIGDIPKTKLKVGSNQNTAVVYITLENDLTETAERLIRARTGREISLSSLENKTKDSILSSLQFNNGLIIKYMKPYETTTADIFLYVSKLAEKYKIISVLIDHISLLSSKDKLQERRHDLGHAAGELKVLATKFKIPLIVAMQLNTQGYKGIPTISNLDESRQPAQIADFVGLMFEQDYVPGQTSPRVAITNGKYVGINIDKNRNGSKGIIYMDFRGSLFKFYQTDYNYSDFNIVQYSQQSQEY